MFVFISYIIFGAILRRELKGGGPYIPVITPLSKVVVFLSEIPHKLKHMTSHDVRTPNQTYKNRFGSLSGFVGDTNEKEKYLLLSRYDGDIKESVVELVDLQSFDVLHTWNPDINSFFEEVDKVEGGEWEHLMRDKNDNRFRLIHPVLFEDGSLLFKNNSPLIKIDKDSELVWIKSDEVYHHSIEEDSEGSFWLCVRYFPYKLDSNVVGNKYNTFFDDGIRKISSNGDILFDKSVSEIFIENGMEYLLFSVGGGKFIPDPIHLNDIQPVEKDTKYWKKGDVFLSLRHQSMVLLYRPETNKIIWKSKNNYFFNQHDVDIIDEKRISLFDNNAKFFYYGTKVDGNSRVVIYDFETSEYSYYLNESLINEDLRTISEGRSQILPNGDLFIEESNYGRTLYFNSDGSLRWTHINRGNNGKVYVVNWSRILYQDEDIEKVNRFLKIKNEITYNE